MTPSLDYDEWFLEIIAYYRRLDFFVDGPFRGLSNFACKEKIEKLYPGWLRERFNEESVWCDKLALEGWIVASDHNRVWRTGAERVYCGDDFYNESLSKLGNISGNVFAPEHTGEEWLAFNDGPRERYVSHTSCEFQGICHHFWITIRGNFANPSIISAVNRIVQPSGNQFRHFGDSTDWFIVFQNEAETTSMLQRGFGLCQKENDSGVLQYPDFGSTCPPQHSDRWLYAKRGLFRYENGDVDGDWEDLRIATDMGVPDLYAQVAQM